MTLLGVLVAWLGSLLVQSWLDRRVRRQLETQRDEQRAAAWRWERRARYCADQRESVQSRLQVALDRVVVAEMEAGFQ